MCGIFGFAKNSGCLSQLELFKLRGAVMDLMLLNESRGSDGTGLAIISEKNSEIFKEATPASSLLVSRKIKEQFSKISSKTLICLGHTRFATVGEPDNKNCHPFATRDFIGIHNGNFLNHKTLIQKYSLTMESEVDSEAVFRALDGTQKVQEMVSRLEEMEGDFALGFTQKKNPSQLYLLRNNDKPLHTAYIRNMKTLFWSSERSHLEYVLKRNQLEGLVRNLEDSFLYWVDTRKFNEKMNFRKIPCQMKMPERRVSLEEDTDIGNHNQMNLFHYEDLKKMGFLEETGMESLSKIRCSLCMQETETSEIFYDDQSRDFVCSSCSFEHEYISQGNRNQEVSHEYLY